MPRRLRITERDDTWVVAVADHDITFVNDERLLSVHEDGDDFSVVDGERATHAAAVIRGDVAWVQIDGEVFECRVDTGGRRTAGADADVLTPPMPATVVRIEVQPGQTVRRGDVLVALDAMKMELPIRAPRDGVVGAVHCRLGELVHPGRVLVELAS